MTIDNLNRVPLALVPIVVGGVGSVAGATADVEEASPAIDVRPFGPKYVLGAAVVRWMGSGAGTLWYAPMTPRGSFTALETAAGVPKTVASGAHRGDYLKLSFAAQYEIQAVPGGLIRIHGASTQGTWEVRF